MNDNKARATVVLERIRLMVKRLDNDFVELGKLFNEAKIHKYYRNFGFASMAGWITSEDINLPLATCRKVLHIVRTAKKLNIPEARLKSVGMARAEVILRSKPSEMEGIFRRAETGCSLRVIKELVRYGVVPIRSGGVFSCTGLDREDLACAKEALLTAQAHLPTGAPKAHCFRYILDVFLTYRKGVSSDAA